MSQFAVTPLPQRAPSVRRRRSAVSRAIAMLALGTFVATTAQADSLLELYDAAKL